MARRVGIYPGTFDPITLGHADIIRRGAKLVDHLIIGVTTNIAKSPMFSDAERMAMVEREVAALGLGNVEALIVIEELAKISGAVAFPVFESCVGPVRAIEHFASESLRQRVIPAVCRGEAMVAVSMVGRRST